MKSKTLLVAQREYIETVKTKTFLIGLALMPVFIGVSMFLPALFIQRSGPSEVRIDVLDRSGQVYASLEKQAADYSARPNVRPRIALRQVEPGSNATEDIQRDLERRVRAHEIFGCLIVPEGVVEGQGTTTYASSNLALNEAQANLERWLNNAVADVRMREKGLDPQLVASVRRPVAFETEALGKEGQKEKRQGEEAVLAPMFTSMAFVMLLFLGIMLVGQMCLNSVIEEKSNRIVEVVLASTSPGQFMTGKILGAGLMGLTLLAAWAGGAYAVAVWKGYARMVSLGNLGYLVLYFILGFMLFSSTFCAIGSVCNSVKEAQNLMGPLSLILVVPLMMIGPIARDPSGTLAVTMSYIPFWTPFVMMSRLAASPRPGIPEIVLSTAVLAAGTAFVFWAAGRIFRVGVLLYGKPPRLGEILRWIRRS
ncbi:MAG: ABC transporter permease [Candidatus Sumerlaeota bacterium]|nr:ABC transporter permease [Candidatus Sumerlaeota bacterium]